MPTNADLALVGASGVGYVGAIGVTAPVGFGALNAGHHNIGFISDEGLTESRDEDTTTFTPWGKLSPIRKIVTRSEKSFQLTPWESNQEVLSLYYRTPLAGLTPVSGVITIQDSDTPSPDPRSFVFDVSDGTNRFRIYLPNGEVSERGEVVYQTTEMIGYPLTITAYPGDDGISVIRYFMLNELP